MANILDDASPGPWFIDQGSPGYHTIRSTAATSPAYNPTIAQVWDHPVEGKRNASLFFHARELAQLAHDVAASDTPLAQDATTLLDKIERHMT